jgi:hypothetical protein
VKRAGNNSTPRHNPRGRAAVLTKILHLVSVKLAPAFGTFEMGEALSDTSNSILLLVKICKLAYAELPANGGGWLISGQAVKPDKITHLRFLRSSVSCSYALPD